MRRLIVSRGHNGFNECCTRKSIHHRWQRLPGPEFLIAQHPIFDHPIRNPDYHADTSAFGDQSSKKLGREIIGGLLPLF